MKNHPPRSSVCAVWLILLALFVFTPAQAQEEGSSERYLQIYSLIGQADALSESGETSSAKAKYQEAYAALLDFKKKNPDWNAKVVSYRLNDLAEKIAPPAATIVEAAPSTAPKPAVAPAVSLPQLKLLEAGAEPRQTLRFQAKVGDTQACVMTMKMGMDMGLGQPMKMPAMIMPMDVAVKAVSAQGDITYETVMGEASVADDPGATPQMAEALKASIASLNGMTTVAVMSNRGFQKSMNMKLPPGASPQIRQSMEQMKESMSHISAPWPEEAVGPGAKWEVKQTVKSQGMTIDQTITYELVSLDGDKASLKTTFLQQAANQKISNPAMPQMKTDLIKMAGQGTGTITLDANHPLPALVTMEHQTDMAMSVNAGGQKQDMNMQMTMDMRLESK